MNNSRQIMYDFINNTKYIYDPFGFLDNYNIE